MVHREPMLILQLEGLKLDGRPGQPGWEESILFRFLVTIIIVIHNGLHFTMGASLVTQMVKNLQCRRPRFNLWVWTISWRREWCLLSFMYGVRDCSDFLDLYASVQLFQHHTEETFFPPQFCTHASFVKSI